MRSRAPGGRLRRSAPCVLRSAVILLLFSAAARADLYPPMGPPFTTWVGSGQAKATIVAADPAEGTAPAAELNRWIERMTGMALPVVAAPPAAGARVFLGGDAAWRRIGARPPDLGPDGYVIRKVDDDLVIAGETNLGTLFGVYAFLERCLGCRWFWPGEGGSVAPRLPLLRVGRVDYTSRADFPIRWTIRDPECARFNGLNVELNEPGDFGMSWFVHTWTRLVEPSRYWKEHPEYYAEAGGRRTDPTAPRAQVNLCTTNPAVLHAAVRKIDEILAADPGISMVSVDPMDTQHFCQCAGCRKLQDPEAPYESRASRLVFDFTNRVAERVAPRHPKLLIKTIAYHTYLAPPPFPVRGNVIVQFCRFTCHNHSLEDPACPESAYFNRYLLAWRKAGARVMLYEYYNKGSWCGLPWPIVHMLRRDFPYLRRNGIEGVASQWTRNEATNGPAYYVATKLLWDSTLDVDALLADFYEKAYAEAAAPMRRYHERLEQGMDGSGLHVAMQLAYRSMHRFLTPELLAGLAADLEEARRVVRDPGARQRVELMGRGLRYAQLVAGYLNVYARRLEGQPAPRWYGQEGLDAAALAEECRAHVEAIRAFRADRTTAGGPQGIGSYEERLLTPATVVSGWFTEGDRPGARAAGLTKEEWLRANQGASAPALPQKASLWIYGNDVDWAADTGPEHRLLARARDGSTAPLGEMGRQDRNGNRKNLAFIFRGVALSRLSVDPLALTIENLPGGPYSTRVFALYLMPDDGTSEDEATRLIETDIEAVRRQALAFVEYGYRGMGSDDGAPLKVDLRIPGAGR